MTEQQFIVEQNKLLAQLPAEFVVFVKRYAWEQGHSSGYDEVLIYIKDLTNGLLPCIENYHDTVY